MIRHRTGFTAIELVVVLCIMMIIAGISLPVVLNVMRRSAVSQSGEFITQGWREARQLAMARFVPVTAAGVKPKHYGVVVVQRAGEQTWVGLVYDNRSAAAIASNPASALLRSDPTSGSTDDTSNPPVFRQNMNRNVIMATAMGAATPSVADQTLVWYVQYRTGMPINPSDVAGGTGGSAQSEGIGVTGSTIATTLRLQTLDFSPSPLRGIAYALSIYHAGIVSFDGI